MYEKTPNRTFLLQKIEFAKNLPIPRISFATQGTSQNLKRRHYRYMVLKKVLQILELGFNNTVLVMARKQWGSQTP
jgi:hypothetical protein